MQEAGEPIVATAIREVREETGVETEIVRYIGAAQWSYDFEGRRWDEVAHFFLMSAKSGAVGDHDAESDEVAWFSLAAAISALRFDSERRVLLEAARLLEHGEWR
jgi:8-oxo-dGTP pyrophosphatase MutT (NUDIX family)